MLTAPTLHQVLDTLPDEEFFSRDADIQNLFHAGLDAARALTPSQFLSGPRKSGKTEILKRVYNRLFLEQPGVVPFYHSVPKSLASGEAFCREYFLHGVLQLLAFLKRDPQLVSAEELSLNSVFQLAYESKHPWLVELVDHFHSSLRKKDLQLMAKLAFHFPVTTSLKTGLRAFVIVDDFHHVSSLKLEEELALLTGYFLTALQSRQAPHVISVSSTQVLQRLFRTTEIPGNAEVYPLKPLTTQGACQLLEGLCDRFNVPLERDLSLSIIEELECQPFYIRAMVLGARRGGAHLQSLRKFAEVYAAELTEGSLQVYFGGLLSSARLNSLERIKALELLQACSRGNLNFSTLQYFRSEEAGQGWDPVRILDALGEVNLIETSLGTVSPIRDRVLGNWIEWNIQHTLHGLPRSKATYQTTIGLLKQLHVTLQFRREADQLERLQRLLSHMNCHSVPAGLLDFEQAGALQQIQEPQRLSAFLTSQEQILLPEVLSVGRLKVKPVSAAGYPWVLLIGRGFEGGRYSDDAETAWVAGYYRDRDPVGLNEIQDFYDQCQLSVKEHRLDHSRLWLVVRSRLNQAAMSFAHAHEIMTSNLFQFELLESRLLPANTRSEERILHPDLATFEITIPSGLDTELVAVRALEQVTDIISFGEKAKGQVRMAVMEACINAKELAESPDARIHLRYQAGEDCLIAQVRVELPGGKEQPPGKPSRTIWNLKLLQSLMDDAQVVHTHLGWELVMTKYLRDAMPQAGAG